MNIRCPYCGSKITITTEWSGFSYVGEYVPNGYECDDYNCGAE